MYNVIWDTLKSHSAIASCCVRGDNIEGPLRFRARCSPCGGHHSIQYICLIWENPIEYILFAGHRGYRFCECE